MADTRFTIKLDRKGQDFFTGVLPNLEPAMRKGIRSGMQQAGFLIVKTLRDGIQRGPKTGRFYTRKGRRKQASAPGEYAGIITGDYLRSADFNVGADNSLVYGFTDPKATLLELGTKNMKPRPALANATSARQSDTFDILAKAGQKSFEQLGRR